MKYSDSQDTQDERDQESFNAPSLPAGAFAWTRDVRVQNAECTINKLIFGTPDELIQPLAVSRVPFLIDLVANGPPSGIQSVAKRLGKPFANSSVNR
jgi:hypothetical protein